MSTSTPSLVLVPAAGVAAAGLSAASNPIAGLGAPNLDGASAGLSAPAPLGAAASHGASSGSAPKVVTFNLEDFTRSSIGITKREWIHTMVWNTNLLALSPRRTMAAMVAFRRTEQRTLASALNDLGHGALKNICVHLGLEVPPKGSSSVSAKCVSTILASVEYHAGVYPELEFPIEGEDVDGASGAEVDDDDASSDEYESKMHHSPPRVSTAKSTPVSPGRTSNRDHTKTNSKIKNSLSKESATQSALGAGSAHGGHGAPLSSAMRNADALAAFSSLPAGPTSRSDDRRRRDAKSKKKSKHHRRVAFSSDSDDDSDSDGRDSKKRRRDKKSKRSDTESSSSDDSSSSDSSSSTDSDSSSSDSDTDRRRKRKSKSSSKSSKRDRHRSSRRERDDIIDDMETSGLARPLAEKFIRNALSGRGNKDSLFDVFKEATFKQSRNQREVLALARILDALRVKNYSGARELVVRRLVGVQTSDTSGNWKMCDAFELVMDRQSYLPDEFLARAIKNVNRMEALEAGNAKRGSSAATGSSSSSSSSGRPKASTYGRGSTGGGSSHTRDRSTDSSRGSKDAPASSSSSSASKGKSSSTGSRGSK